MTGIDAASVITDFYGLLNRGDAEELAAFVRSRFAEDAAVTWPDSFAHGGTRTGRERLATFFARVAATDPPRGGTGFDVQDLLASGGRAAVRLAFDWIGGDDVRISNGAVEWWTFDEQGLVSSIRPYYWDGPAIVAAG